MDLVANTNTISAKADENQVIDEPSWPHCGYGEAGSGICGRLYQSKKFAKGGQTVMCMYAGKFQIRVYTHFQNLYNHKKQGWPDASPYKLYILQCDFMEMVCGSMSRKKNIYHENPTTPVDNYFVTENVLDWPGNAGIGIIHTNARNGPPKDIKPFYLHKENKNETMRHTKFERFFETIVAVKKKSRGFQRVHVSFKSTSPCNITSVNALNNTTTLLNYARNSEASIKNSG